MNGRFKTIGIIALAPYLVLSQSAYPIAAGSADAVSKSRMLIAEAKSASDTTPASAGVKLLREIFKSLRGSNQLALNNPTKQLASAQQQIQGALNPLLAIRPSEKSLEKAHSFYSPQYSRADASARNSLASAMGSGAQVKEYGNYKKKMAIASAQTSSGWSAPAPTAAPGAPAAPAAPTSAPAMRFSFSPNVPKTQLPSVSMGAPNRDGNNYRGTVQTQILDERPILHDYREAPDQLTDKLTKTDIAQRSSATMKATADSNNGSASSTRAKGVMNSNGAGRLSQQNSQALARSVSNLMETTKQLSELSQSSESSVKNFGIASKSKVRDEKTIATAAGGPVIQEYDNSAQSRVANGAKDAINASQNSGDDSADAASSPLMTPYQPGQYRIMRNQLMALLPPSVVSGIPLARLGATEHELAASLSKKTTTSKQKIDDWTVYTVPGATARSAAVQLYLRHSVVEAIRVFQPSYLGLDVGIKIGDDLQTIKGKFGEPSLILPEPSVPGLRSGGQNYVYPISHVAFQLARGKSQPTPQVVSVLIFDVQ